MSNRKNDKWPGGVTSASLNGQLSALMIDLMNALRRASEEEELALQRDSLAKGLSEVLTVREFIGSPESILGSAETKHGEIAEVVEVGIRNAFDYVSQVEPTAALAASRIAPEDILLDGIKVQMKTINGANNSLRHVQEHMNKYETFGRDGSHYLISKDHHETIQRVLQDGAVDLNDRTVTAIKGKVEEIERLAGKPFDEVVKPSSTTYAEVQQGAIHAKLEKVEEELHDKNTVQEKVIVDEHAPSLTGALQAAVGAAAISAVFGFAGSAASKYFNEGKNLFRGDFDVQDWKDVGLDTATCTAVGGLSAAAIYGLTNFVGTSAPVAGAFVGAARGVAIILPDYVSGKIRADAFIDQALFLCTDVSITTIFTVAGQMVIPVPVVGSLVGAVAGKYVAEMIDGASSDLQSALAKKLEENLAGLEDEHRRILDTFRAEILPKSRMAEFAFATVNNAQCLGLSASLARMHGVPEAEILSNPADVIAFLQGPSNRTMTAFGHRDWQVSGPHHCV